MFQPIIWCCCCSSSEVSEPLICHSHWLLLLSFPMELSVDHFLIFPLLLRTLTRLLTRFKALQNELTCLYKHPVSLITQNKTWKSTYNCIYYKEAAGGSMTEMQQEISPLVQDFCFVLFFTYWAIVTSYFTDEYFTYKTCSMIILWKYIVHCSQLNYSKVNKIHWLRIFCNSSGVHFFPQRTVSSCQNRLCILVNAVNGLCALKPLH